MQKNKSGVARNEQHACIRLLIIDNSLDEAVTAFEKVIIEHGPHVGLLCDYAGCLYELGRFIECFSVVDRIANEYKNAFELLSNDSKKRTALMLAKFYEEMAEPAVALEWLTTALEFCKTMEDKKWIFANELRILSYFGLKRNLQSKYLVLLELYNSEPSQQIEILHALCWAEWALFGYHHAVKRWSQINQRNLNAMDQRLAQRDFIEICLLSDVHHADENLSKAISILSNQVVLGFDRILLGLAGNPTLKNSELICISKLSPMMRIRLIVLKFKRTSLIAEKDELLKKYMFLTQELNLKSKEYFSKIRPAVIRTAKIELRIDTSKKRLVSGASSLELKLTGIQIKFLQTVLHKDEEITLDTIAQSIWGYDSDESIYHRIRMIVYRLNAGLQTQMGEKLFDVTKNSVLINPHFKIISD